MDKMKKCRQLTSSIGDTQYYAILDTLRKHVDIKGIGAEKLSGIICAMAVSNRIGYESAINEL